MPRWDKHQFNNDGISISKRQVKGHSPIYKNGVNFKVNAGASATVWTFGGLYPWSALNTPQTLYVLSDNAADVGRVRVEGLDLNWEEIEEDINFNGLTSGSSIQQFLRVNEATFFDSGDTNVGNITIRASSPTGTVVGHIEPGFTTSQAGIYSVPLGHTAYVRQLSYSVNRNESAQFRAYIRTFGNSFRIGRLDEVYQNYTDIEWTVPVFFPARTDFDVRVGEVETNNTRVTANFEVTLVEDQYLYR